MSVAIVIVPPIVIVLCLQALALLEQGGRSQTQLSRPVAAAVAGSTLMMLATVALPPLRSFLGLSFPTRTTAAAIAVAALAAMPLARRPLLPLPPPEPALPIGS
jgi:hypothetical protein